MTRPDVILFDLGGVLVELAGVETMLGWCPHLDSVETMWQRWLHSPAVRRYEAGQGDEAAFAEALVEEFELPVAPEAFLAAFNAWPKRLFPGADALLRSLRPHYRLASASNTNALHWRRFDEEWSLPEYFDANFPSYQVGALKPDAEYFGHVVDALGVPAHAVLFVDDNRINVEAARKVGLDAHHVAGFDGLARTLAERAPLG